MEEIRIIASKREISGPRSNSGTNFGKYVAEAELKQVQVG